MQGASVEFVGGTTLTTENWFDDVDAHVYGDLVTIASHATTGAIWATGTTWVDWTGTETTTAFPNAAKASDVRFLKCAGVAKFTTGANMLVQGVATGTTITCAANYVVTVFAVTTTQFLLTISSYFATATFSEINNATTTGASTINWLNGNNQRQTEPTGAITYTFTAPSGPCHLQLRILSDGTSTAYTHVWPATVKWMGETWAALTNKNAIISFWYDGTDYWAVGVNQA